MLSLLHFIALGLLISTVLVPDVHTGYELALGTALCYSIIVAILNHKLNNRRTRD